VLIDADKASASVVKELLEEVAKQGTATVKRAYADWTTPNLVGWKEHLHRHAIQPMQQFAFTKGKNSTDSAFIIDAMDLLYAGNLNAFCLVSSDSDFTRLATRMREAGKIVCVAADTYLERRIDSSESRPVLTCCLTSLVTRRMGRRGQRILQVSAATIDRVLAAARAHIGGQRKRRKGVGSAIRRSIPVRTFADWLDPPPGFFEIDMVEHCGGDWSAMAA
jgi:hypothetical protein